MDNLIFNIKCFLENNSLPFNEFQIDNNYIFKVGILGNYQIMLLEVIIDSADKNAYTLRCWSVKVSCSNQHELYQDSITQFNSRSHDVNVSIDNSINALVFTIYRKGNNIFNGEEFIQDFENVVNSCDQNTMKIHDSGFKNKIFDPDLTFIQNLTNITFSARYYSDIPDISNFTQNLVNNIIQQMGLEEKLLFFRSLEGD